MENKNHPPKYLLALARQGKTAFVKPSIYNKTKQITDLTWELALEPDDKLSPLISGIPNLNILKTNTEVK